MPHEFIHLHNHTHYSLLDAIATIDDLVDAAVDNNMPAVALTDHGVMYGAMEFYKKCKKKGVKPIIGCEVYVAQSGTRHERGKRPTLPPMKFAPKIPTVFLQPILITPTSSYSLKMK